MTDTYDIAIVGGGMVGASLAVALAPLGLRMALIEAVPPRDAGQPSYDDRSTAVAATSRNIFESMGVWRAIAPQATPIRRIHVSDRGGFGFTRLDARREGVEALGYVVENRHIGHVLWATLEGGSDLYVACPARVSAVEPTDDDVVLRLQRDDAGDETLTARLVIAADGALSALRRLLALEADVREYDQCAVIANVSPAGGHGNVAYERFTPTGPLALLPMTGGRCSLVWTLSPAEADEVMALDDGAFLERLQAAFGFRLGRFQRVGQRHAYPLALTRLETQSSGRVLFVGNAAHGLHPVAGQGFNLGLRDVATLAEVLADARESGVDDAGDVKALARYLDWRRADHERVIRFTDGLVRLFSNRLPLLRAARSAGLLGLDLLPPVRSLIARRGMGQVGTLPRLARGLPLT